jgi:hypothetical protein
MQRTEYFYDSSPSENYKVCNVYYTENGLFTRKVAIYRGDTLIKEADMHSDNLYCSFFNKDGQDWIQYAPSHISQYFMNLETGEEYNNYDETDRYGFCWAELQTNPSSSILAIIGCHWAFPYQWKFYDFKDPSKGWHVILFDVESFQTLYKDFSPSNKKRFHIICEEGIDNDENDQVFWKNDTEFALIKTRDFHPESGRYMDDLERNHPKLFKYFQKKHGKEYFKHDINLVKVKPFSKMTFSRIIKDEQEKFYCTSIELIDTDEYIDQFEDNNFIRETLSKYA